MLLFPALYKYGGNMLLLFSVSVKNKAPCDLFCFVFADYLGATVYHVLF